MEANEKSATPCKKTSRADETSRSCCQQEESSKADQEGGRTSPKDPQALSREQERERVARWMRAGEVWTPS